MKKRYLISVSEGFDTIRRFVEKDERIAETLSETAKSLGFEVQMKEVQTDV